MVDAFRQEDDDLNGMKKTERINKRIVRYLLTICMMFFPVFLTADASCAATAADQNSGDNNVSIMLSDSKITVIAGTRYRLKAITKNTASKITWTSSDKKKATVKNGLVTGVKAGKATITAKVDGQKATCVVTVKKPTIRLSSATLSIKEGKKKQLTATVKGKSEKVTWKSADKKIAFVNSKGMITARSAGKTTVTATANGVSAVCKVTVKKKTAVTPTPAPGPAGTSSEVNSAVKAAYNALPEGNGRWAVYVCDLKNDVSGYAPSSASKRMQAASLIKLYIMAAVYENFDSLSAAYGRSTLDRYLYPMITDSDNYAANALVAILGGGDSQAGMNVVNDFCTAHGYTSTHMGRLLLASNESDDNYTSVVDCGRFLCEIYRSAKAEAGGEADSDNTGTLWTGQQGTAALAHADDMFNLLKAQTRRNKIPASMPAGVHVANKTGELSGVENDAGIIYDTPDGSDLVIVFMSEDLRAAGDAQKAIADASRIIYDAFHNIY